MSPVFSTYNMFFIFSVLLNGILHPEKKMLFIPPNETLHYVPYPSILLYHCLCGTEIIAWFLLPNITSVINFHVGFFMYCSFQRCSFPRQSILSASEADQ